MPTRREFGFGLQFLAIGLAVGNSIGVGYGYFSREIIWVTALMTVLILFGGALKRS